MAMVEEEERSRSQADAEETNLPYEMVEDRYDGTTGGDAEQDTLLSCGKRTVKDKAEIPIAGSRSRDRQFRARQLETPDIGEASGGKACTIEGKAATDNEEPVAMDKSGAGRKDPSSPS